MVNLSELDAEWVELIIEAKCMGLKLEDVRAFLANRMEDRILEKDCVINSKMK